MTIAEAEKGSVKLVNKVDAEGISVDLERDNKVIARLTPAELASETSVEGGPSLPQRLVESCAGMV